MIKDKDNINWYRWICTNIRDPEMVSETGRLQVFDAKYFCNTKREFAIALWAILDSTETPAEIEQMLDEAFVFEENERGEEK